MTEEVVQKPKKLSVTQIAIQIEAQVTFWRSDDDIPYATFLQKDKLVTWPVESRPFDRYVVNRYMELANCLPSPTNQAMIKLYLSTRADEEGTKTSSIRIKRRGDATFLNMCDQAWSCIKITKDGWSHIGAIPRDVPLVRSATAGTYAIPEREGADINLLRKYVNFENEEDFKLIVGFLVSCLREDTEYPVLAITGTQDSAKTTLSNILLRLIDPGNDSAQSLPNSEDDIAVLARTKHLLAFDNISFISNKMSDTICKLATGLTVSKRRLYTNHGLVSYTVSRPVILNGISDVVERDDMGRRIISVFLPSIAKEKKQSAAMIMEAFEQDRPKIFAALLNAVACAMKNYPTTEVKEVKGLLSVARWVEAASPSFGWQPGEFLAAYNTNRETNSGTLLDGDDFAQLIVEFLSNEPSHKFEGTYPDFCNRLNSLKLVPSEKKWFPSNAKAMINKLRRIMPALVSCGIKAYGLTAQNGKIWRTSDLRRLRVFAMELDKTHKNPV